MALIDRITRLFRRTQPNLAATTHGDVPPPPRPTVELTRFAVERDRRSVVELCRRMADEDPRADQILRTLARDVAAGVVQVQITGGTSRALARRIAQDLIDRLLQPKQIEDLVRHVLRDGDVFLEVIVDATQTIQGLAEKPALEVRRYTDDQDEFYDPARAFWWADAIWAGYEAPRDATWFAQWQICHLRWDPDPSRRYGRPLLASARKAYKRMDEGELDIAVRRKTRAGLKYLHILEEATPEELEEYKEQNKEVLDNPFAAVSDFFMNKKGAIEVVEGDARLAEIGDVEHHIATFFIGSPVPRALIGYGAELNRDVLEDQKRQYDAAVAAVIAWVDEQLLFPLIELAWLLAGIWPPDVKYELSRPVRTPITGGLLAAAGDAIVKLKQSGVVADELLLEFLAKLIPGLDPVRALELLREQRASAAPPPPAPATDPATRPAPGDADPPPEESDEDENS